MHIALLGATGGTGRLVAENATLRGHRITALVRNPDKFNGLDSAEMVVGDGTDVAVVADLVAGQDAVIVTISSRGAKVPVASAVAHAVLQSTAAKSGARLIFTSTYGMVATRPRLVAPLLRRILAAPFTEQRIADEQISASTSNWTIVRATRLTDRPGGGQVRVTPDPLLKGPFSLPRADLASQLVTFAEREDITRTIINVSGGRT